MKNTLFGKDVEVVTARDSRVELHDVCSKQRGAKTGPRLPTESENEAARRQIAEEQRREWEGSYVTPSAPAPQFAAWLVILNILIVLAVIALVVYAVYSFWKPVIADIYRAKGY